MVESKKERINKLIKEKGVVWTTAYILNNQIREKISDKYALWKNKKQLE